MARTLTDVLEDIDPDEPSYPGTSRFLRQLRFNEANSRVPRSTGGCDDTDDDADTNEPCVPIEATDAGDDGSSSNNSRGNGTISPRAPDEKMCPVSYDTGASDHVDCLLAETDGSKFRHSCHSYPPKARCC
ncbi:hypothetical protein GGI24_003144 [Coemansia furcata]|nr:hypothetical protein GGI24_003144 [Coemansia furcata]